MADQIYFEDVEIGSSLPTLKKHPTPRQLVMWAGASGDYYEIHYDKNFAKSQGLTDVIVHGMLSASFFAQLITGWIGEWGTLKKLSTSNRQVIFVNEDVYYKGIVSKKYNSGNDNYVEIELWAENNKGEKCILCNAQVVLPDRDSSRLAG